MPSVGIISNPHAGINKRDPQHNTLVWYVLGNRGQFEVTQSPEQLYPLCEEFQQRGIDHIGIIGGDGTICLALQAIYNAYHQKKLPKILVMRGGTMNVIAGNLGIFGKPTVIMNDFLDIFHSRKPYHEAKLSTLCVNGKLGFVFGHGASAKFLVEFYKTKKSPVKAGLFFGQLTLGGLLRGESDNFFRELTACEEAKLLLTDDSNPNPTHLNCGVSLTYASTLPKAPFGIHLCKNLKQLENSRAEMVAVSAKGRPLVAETVKVLLGHDSRSENVHRHLFQKCTLHVLPKTLYTLDGELFEAENGEIQIDIGPQFTFCSPYSIAQKI